MLQAMALTLQSGLEIAVGISALLLVLAKTTSGQGLTWARRGIAAGILFSILAAIGLDYGWNRETYEGIILFLASALELTFLVLIWKRDWHPGVIGAALILLPVAIVLVLVRGVDLILFPTKIFIQNTSYLNTELLLKFSGGLLGIILAVLISLNLFKIEKSIDYKKIMAISSLIFLTLIARQMVILVQILLVNGILPMEQWLLDLIIPLINRENWFFYALIILSSALILTAAFSKKEKAETASLNPAMRRKIVAQNRRELRRISTAGIFTIAAVLLLFTNQVYANKKIELSPAVPVTPVQGEVVIPLIEVNDGNLYRFGYTASDGTLVRFIVIKKSGSAYGVGLDACEICGATGYYQRGDQVICLNCDVVMNIATIGFSGGCNPVPLQNRVSSGKLIIPASALEDVKERFED